MVIANAPRFWDKPAVKGHHSRLEYKPAALLHITAGLYYQPAALMVYRSRFVLPTGCDEGRGNAAGWSHEPAALLHFTAGWWLEPAALRGTPNTAGSNSNEHFQN
jgi:hypothetical protein